MKQFYNDFGLLVLRLSGGLPMIYAHGWPKLGRLSADPIQFADPIGIGPAATLWLAVATEIVGAGLITLGLFTRWASLSLIATMGVAFFIVHSTDPFARKEMAFLYLAIYIAVALLGPGRFSMDRQILKR